MILGIFCTDSWSADASSLLRISGFSGDPLRGTQPCFMLYLLSQFFRGSSTSRQHHHASGVRIAGHEPSIPADVVSGRAMSEELELCGHVSFVNWRFQPYVRQLSAEASPKHKRGVTPGNAQATVSFWFLCVVEAELLLMCNLEEQLL